MKRTIAIVCTLLLLAALTVGCAKSEPAATQPAATQPAETQPKEPEGVYVLVNGQYVVPDVPFADYKDKLGAESKPAETIGSCDEDSDWSQTSHFYGSVKLVEDKDGILTGIEVDGGDAAVNGKIKVGATAEEIKAVLGTPDTDETWGIYYDASKPMITFWLDEETGKCTGFAVMTNFIM